uniref:CD59 glycoprotein n=1 Tax=Mola mola TaxID=94237 RepID=A0A3Q4BYW0_MOLML
KMKLLVFALAVALCHRCVSREAGGACELSVETCKPGKDGCAAVRFLRKPFGEYQKCMALQDCEMLMGNSYINAKCCANDMCNTFNMTN